MNVCSTTSMAKILECCTHTRIAKQGKVFENVLIMNVAFWIICGNKQSTKRKSVKQSKRTAMKETMVSLTTTTMIIVMAGYYGTIECGW